ncbi:hypothetical protein PV325_008599 [Microctonus aethiopoides]|nr:hypothetical protein PV325_008599 [Microctonus aethiopoides]
MENPIVKIEQGQLRGVAEKSLNGKSYFAFRGIPYAKPPLGNLRFKDSEPAERWFGVRDAFNFGGQCAQRDLMTHKIFGSDDCLYLNVYTPILNPLVPKAVMVWIHGGGFLCGSGNDDVFGPDYLIEKDIVLITVNYRLGILGFLNADDEEAPGNQGLKDQVLALKWIQKNITQFGGDPNNVTICGGSAGGALVHYLTISPLAQGLFHKAVMHSGTAVNAWASPSKSPIETVKKLATLLGKNMSNVKEFIGYLRTLEPLELVKAENEIRTFEEEVQFIFAFTPSVDSKAKNPFLTIPIEDAAKIGIKVPCICGIVKQEGISAIQYLCDKKYDKIYEDPVLHLIHPNLWRFFEKYNLKVDDVKRFYFGDEKISSKNIKKIVTMLSDTNIIIGVHHMIKIQSEISDLPIYYFKFEYGSECPIIKRYFNTNIKGARHAEELSYLFNQKSLEIPNKQPPKPGSIEYQLIQKMTDLWSNFAKTGNPTPTTSNEISVEWKPVDSSNEYKCLHITENLKITKETNVTQQLIDSAKITVTKYS